MEKHRAIPKGYMTVGEVAKKMGVTVRTLQYYDKQELLSPSGESEGGRRLYTDKDLVQLHQIMSMKHLGFSLEDIKNRLVNLDTPKAFANALTEQAAAVSEKINSLNEALQELLKLKDEVLLMHEVDFKKYADIIVNLQMKNDFYWMIKHFDNSTLDTIRSKFDKESGLAMMEKFNRLQDEAIKLSESGVLPSSPQGIAFAEDFWCMITEFTGGDMSLLPNLMQLGDIEGPTGSWTDKQAAAKAFTEPALEAYFDSIKFNPFEVKQ